MQYKDWNFEYVDREIRIGDADIALELDVRRHGLLGALSGRQQLPSDGDTDSRFSDEEWSKHPFFYYLKRQYQIMSAYMESVAESADMGDDEKHQEQIYFFTKQLVDLFSPANFLASNPVAMKRASRVKQSASAGSSSSSVTLK